MRRKARDRAHLRAPCGSESSSASGTRSAQILRISCMRAVRDHFV